MPPTVHTAKIVQFHRRLISATAIWAGEHQQPDEIDLGSPKLPQESESTAFSFERTTGLIVVGYHNPKH